MHPSAVQRGIHGAIPFARKYAGVCFRTLESCDLAHARIAMYVYGLTQRWHTSHAAPVLQREL